MTHPIVYTFFLNPDMKAASSGSWPCVSMRMFMIMSSADWVFFLYANIFILPLAGTGGGGPVLSLASDAEVANK